MTICQPSLSLPARAFKPNPFGKPEISSFIRATSGSAYTTTQTGTLGAVAANIARHEFDSATSAYNGWLIEEQRTNLVTYSDQFDNAAWNKAFTAIAANATAAPDGAAGADKLYETTVTDVHTVYRSFSGSAATRYTFSLFVKAAGRSSIVINLQNIGDPGTNFGCFFNLASGAWGNSYFSGPDAKSAVQYPGGWWRLSVSKLFTNAYATCQVELRLSPDGATTYYAGDGSSGVYVWGAQLEVGSSPTSYIPTTSASVTRPADIMYIPLSSFDFSVYEGTFFVDFSTRAYDPIVLAADDGSNNNYVRLLLNSGILKAQIASAGVFQGQMTLGALTADTLYRVAFAWKAGDAAACVNGGTVSTLAPASLGSGLTTLWLGCGWGGGGQLNGTIRRVALYPRRLANADLQLITAF